MRRRGLFGDVAAYYVKSLVVCIWCNVQGETESHSAQCTYAYSPYRK